MPQPFAHSLAVAVVVAVVASSAFAQPKDPWVGKWKLNMLKSLYTPGPLPPIKSQIITHEAVPNGIRTIVETVDARGTIERQEITAMFDGKEHELKGAPMPATRVYRRIDDRTYEYVQRVNGRVTVTTRVEISPDGQTRTNTTTGTNAQGQKVHNVVVFEPL